MARDFLMEESSSAALGPGKALQLDFGTPQAEIGKRLENCSLQLSGTSFTRDIDDYTARAQYRTYVIFVPCPSH
jgi:hypothetical protein